MQVRVLRLGYFAHFFYLNGGELRDARTDHVWSYFPFDPPAEVRQSLEANVHAPRMMKHHVVMPLRGDYTLPEAPRLKTKETRGGETRERAPDVVLDVAFSHV